MTLDQVDNILIASPLQFPDNHQRVILHVLFLVKICALYIFGKLLLLLSLPLSLQYYLKFTILEG